MQDIISLYEARPEQCAGGDGKGQFCRFVINSNLITAVMIDHFFDILWRCRFGIECENSRRHFRSLEPSKLNDFWHRSSDIMWLQERTNPGGFHLPEAGWRGARESGIKWTKSRRRSARSADRAACLVPSFLLLSGRQRQATQNTIKTQKTTQTT